MPINLANNSVATRLRESVDFRRYNPTTRQEDTVLSNVLVIVLPLTSTNTEIMPTGQVIEEDKFQVFMIAASSTIKNGDLINRTAGKTPAQIVIEEIYMADGSQWIRASQKRT